MCMFYADLMPQDRVKTGSQPDNSSKNFSSNWEDKCYSESLTVQIAGIKLDLLYQATFPNVRYDDIISFFSILQMVPMYQVTYSANAKKNNLRTVSVFSFHLFLAMLLQSLVSMISFGCLKTSFLMDKQFLRIFIFCCQTLLLH